MGEVVDSLLCGGGGGCTLLEESEALPVSFSDRSCMDMKTLHRYEVMS
jgi:hypothetical protein